MKVVLSVLGFLFTSFSIQAHAATLYDQNGWNVLLGGFAELDIIHDSTRKELEVLGSSPLTRPGSSNGDNGALQFSPRNSRLSFSVLPPVQAGWKTKGLVEVDFLGFLNGTTESSNHTSATMRMRHAYGLLEKDDWQIFFGQTWTLFGWQTAYMPPTVTVSPVTGVTYERTPQVTVLKKFDFVQAGLSLLRPSQRDSEIPNIDGGIRVAFGTRKAPYQASSSAEIALQPMSLAITGTVRSFEAPNSTTTTGKNHYTGFGVAADVMIPILTRASEEDDSHALVFVGEFTTGSGYGDEFANWTGNMALQVAGASNAATSVNMDPGLAGFDAAGNFQVVKLKTYNAALQYHLPKEWSTLFTAGYARLESSNINTLTPVAAGSVLYDRENIGFINVFHDFTKQVRAGFEYSYEETHYTDGVVAHNSRYQLSGLFRF